MLTMLVLILVIKKHFNALKKRTTKKRTTQPEDRKQLTIYMVIFIVTFYIDLTLIGLFKTTGVLSLPIGI